MNPVLRCFPDGSGILHPLVQNLEVIGNQNPWRKKAIPQIFEKRFQLQVGTGNSYKQIIIPNNNITILIMGYEL